MQAGIACGPFDEAGMAAWAADLARALRPGDCLALHGDLGAGKTTLARAIIRAIANDPALEVPSPTFTLVQDYDLPLPVIHADLYRVSDPGEWVELGIDEALERSVALIEWPQRAGTMLPDPLIEVSFEEQQSGTRTLTFTGPAPFIERLQRSLGIRRFLEQAGWGAAHRATLAADASARTYEQVTLDGRRAIVMDAPRQPDGPAVYAGKPYSQIAGLAEDVGAFVAIARALRDAGLAAPQIHAADIPAGLVLLEHLGSGSVLDGDGKPVPARYEASARMLAHLHGHDWPRHLPADETHTHTVPLLDETVFTIEASLFADWYLTDIKDGAVPEALLVALQDAWRTVFGQLGAAGTTLILRDFHSPNIIWRDDEADPVAKVGLIDFQDALIGSPAYDVISLAHDARVDVNAALTDAIHAAYADERIQLDPSFDQVAFRREAAILCAQRCAKILGIFVRLDKRDGKPGYRRHLPRVARAFWQALDHEALTPVRTLLANHGLTGEHA